MPRASKAAKPAAKASRTKKSGATSKKAAKTSATKSTAKNSAAKKSAAKKTTAKKASKKAPAKKTTAKKATAKKATAKKATATKTAVKKTAAKKARTSLTNTAAPAKPKLKGEKDKKFLTAERALLLQERDTYEEQAAALKAEADQLAAEAEPGDIQFDEESGEGDSMSIERERDLALSAQARAHVEEIDRALSKMDVGTYGACERCGELIPRARLKAIPYAALCVGCKSGGLASRR